ncbi:hypothetical protein Q9233_011216, partial [Columba guinea]
MDPKLLDLTLGVKIPVTPGSKPVFSRGKLGEKQDGEECWSSRCLFTSPAFHLFAAAALSCPAHTLEHLSQLHRPSCSFDLGDPLCRLLSTEYNSLHDPHLQAYHQRKDNVRRMKREGFITSDGNVGLDVGLVKTALIRQAASHCPSVEEAAGASPVGLISPQVVCSLKEFNEYRQYLATRKLEAEKAFIREQEKLREHLAKLEHAPELPGVIDTSRLREWLLQEQSKSLPGRERKRRQKQLRVIEKRVERLEALEKELRLLQQGVCRLQQQQPGKRRQPDTPSGSELSAPGGRPSPRTAGEEAPPSRQASLLRAVLAEDEELEEKAETVVQEVLERVKALDQSVHVLRRVSPELTGRLFASARGAEPLGASPAHRRDDIRRVAQEIVDTVLESFGEHVGSSMSGAAEPGLAPRQKLSELVTGEAAQVGKSGEESWREVELAASNTASLQSALDQTATEAVGSISSTFSSFVAAQFEQVFCCQFSEVLKLQDVTEGQGSPRASEQQTPEASKTVKLPPLKNTANVSLVCRELAEESIQKAISRVQQLDAELGDYARTIVQEVLETVKKKLQQETKSEQTSEKLQPRKLLPPLRLPPPVSPSEEAGKFKKSSPTALPPLPRGAEQDARRPADGLQKPRDGTSGATARVMELSALLVQSQKQNEEKEKIMKTLQDTVEILVVLDASDSTASVICPDSSQQAEPSTIPSVLSSGGAAQAFALVQEALARRRGATRALHEELSARQDSIDSLLQQHRQQEEKCRKLQQRLEQLQEECATSSSQRQHLQSLVEALRRRGAQGTVKQAELGHRRQHLGEAATGPMDPKLLDLTLGVKIPVTPGSKPVFSRGKLGEKLHRPSGSFDLGDPLGHRMSNEYNSLHDPHLQAYHQRKDNLERLKRQGFLTSNGNVVCSLKEFNQYRQYRTMLKLEAEKAFIREQ